MDIFPGGAQGSELPVELTSDKSSRFVLQIITRLLHIVNAPCGKPLSCNDEDLTVSLAGLLRILKGGGWTAGCLQNEASVSLGAIEPSKWRPVRLNAYPCIASLTTIFTSEFLSSPQLYHTQVS
jgi:hypothetical protein